MTLLKEKVKEKGVTQQKLADLTGVTDAHINYILNGSRSLSYNLAVKLAEQLNYKSPITVILAQNNINLDNEIDHTLSTADEIIQAMVCSFLINELKKDRTRKEKKNFVNKILSLVWIYENEEEKQKYEGLI